jgi:GDP-L-fucose synthase
LNSKIFIAGQEGLVGSSIYKFLKKKKKKLIKCSRNELDLTNQNLVRKWFKKNRPDVVINAAGRVGGILDNKNYQHDYIYINSIIGLNLIHSSVEHGVKKFVNLGSACIYPKNTRQPIKESYLLSSYLEPTNEGYALAKILSLKYLQYLKQKYGYNFITIMPANLYGEGDNFNLKSSHVLPALVKKFTNAKIENKSSVEIWGSGNVKREFLNVEDLSSAIYFILKKDIKHDYLNVGSGEHYSISKIAEIIKRITGFKGKIVYNRNFPDGVRERKLNSQKIRKLGWKPQIKFLNGIKKYQEYYLKDIYPKESN